MKCRLEDGERGGVGDSKLYLGAVGCGAGEECKWFRIMSVGRSLPLALFQLLTLMPECYAVVSVCASVSTRQTS
jgi:hypothetical protein